GAGDGSHNFLITDGPDAGRVLKLPFVSEKFARQFPAGRGQIGRLLLAWMGTTKPPPENRPVEVYHYRQGDRHVIVEHVRGTQTARDFGEHIIRVAKRIRDEFQRDFSAEDLAQFEKFKILLIRYFPDAKSRRVIAHTTPREFEHDLMFA